MAKDYDQIAKSLGAVNYDSLAATVEPQTPEQIGTSTGNEVRSQMAGRIGATLPWVGGGIGGLVGGISGATIGGMAGKLGEQGLTGTLSGSPAEAVNTIGGSGVTQGLLQGIPDLFGAAGNLGMRLALKATPEVTRTAVKEGITATKMGLARLMSRIGATAIAEKQIVQAAGSQGKGWIPTKDIADAVFQKAHGELRGAPAEEIDALASLKDRFIARNPTDLHPVNQLEKRRYYDRQNIAFHAGQPRGAKPALDAKSVWNRVMADELRQTLRTSVPEIMDPAIYGRLTGKASTPAELQALKAVVFPVVRRSGGVLERAAGAAARPAIGAAIGGAAGAAYSPENRLTHGLEGVAAGAVLTHPATMSWLSLIASNPMLQDLVPLLARAGGASYSASQK
jgi:hypothetical protein